MRKLKYHVAVTVDGFICHKDHTVDGFIGEGDHATDYLASLKSDYDTVLMGRRTYEFGFQFGVTNPYPWLKQYVLSRSMTQSPDPAVELVGENVIDFVQELKQGAGKDIYLCGGGELAATLAQAHLIDELLLKLNPVLFGEGVSLFASVINQTALTLLNSKVYDNGVLLLHYQVNS